MKAFDTVLLAGAVLLGLLLLGPVLTIPLHVPINYNEGWNAGFDTRAVTPGTGPLYPGTSSFVFNNYPPLGFFIVGAAGRLAFGNMILAGRVLALCALLATAGLVGVCVRQLGGTSRAAAASALLLLLLVCTFYRQYVAMDDPQWLAHALMLGALAWLLRAGPLERLRTRRRPVLHIFLAALLMVAGGLVKHNLVALPLAVTLWLAWLNPGAALVWLGAAAMWLVLGLASVDAMFGRAAFVDVLQHHRVFQAHRIIRAVNDVAPMLPLAAVLATRLRRRSVGDGAVLIGLFASIALVTGVLQRTGEGVNFNAHFETAIALCMGFGLILTLASAGAASWRGFRLAPSSLCVFAALPVIGAMPWHLPAAWRDVSERGERQRAWQPMIARLAAAKGPVGCETPSICIWAHKPFSVDVFNLTQSMVAGGSSARFRTMLARREFGLFEYEPKSTIHKDAVRTLGYDPLVQAFVGTYAPVGTGPHGTVLLAPVRPGMRLAQ